jgi:Family of unknown function (DUF6340)
MNKSLILLFSCIVLFSCSKYGYVSVNYPLNPQVVLPQDVKSIAYVNRSNSDPHLKNTAKRVLEAIVTAEVGGSDKIASEECQRGIFEQLRGRVGPVIVAPSNINVYGTGTREIPAPLSWNAVKTICDTTHSQALLCLESFDSNTDLAQSVVTNEIGNLIGSGKLSNPIPNQVHMNVTSFWRMYYPAKQSIIDEYRCNKNIGFTGPIPSPEALPQAAFSSGREYISRFLSDYYTVSRKFYKRGLGRDNEGFQIAFRKSATANWKEAAEIWEQLSHSNNRRNAGRACLNLAVTNEVLGNIDAAIVWARKAYENYNDKIARYYVNSLLEKKRIGF